MKIKELRKKKLKKNKEHMKKIKTWLKTDIGIRYIILSLIALSIIFMPYLFGLLFGFDIGPTLGIWFMGFLILTLTILISMLVGVAVLGCITYIQYGEFEPVDLLEDIVMWFEDRYEKLITKIQNEN